MKNTNIWSNPYNPFQKFKILAWYDRMKQIKTGDFAPPVNIALDIIQGTSTKKLCGSFKCTFCMSDKTDEGKEARIPREILFNIPEFYSKWGVKSICLAGHSSDPCMYNHDDLIKFLRLCHKWNVEVGFVSNGAYYSDELIEEVARNCNWSGWSINAGTEEDHMELTKTKSGTFQKILGNMEVMANYIKRYKLDHDIGYKFLITDTNHTHIIEAIKEAKIHGARHFQIRPCELPMDRVTKINTELVEQQIQEGLQYEIPGVFEVFGIREKFTPNFTKQPPKRCIASPLGSTWKADGTVVICPDRRWSAHLPNMSLGNFIEEGLESIKRKWGGPEHKKMIDEANKHLDECIRCTSLQWHNIYEHTVENDDMDITLI